MFVGRGLGVISTSHQGKGNQHFMSSCSMQYMSYFIYPSQITIPNQFHCLICISQPRTGKQRDLRRLACRTSYQSLVRNLDSELTQARWMIESHHFLVVDLGKLLNSPCLPLFINKMKIICVPTPLASMCKELSIAWA